MPYFFVDKLNEDTQGQNVLVGDRVKRKPEVDTAFMNKVKAEAEECGFYDVDFYTDVYKGRDYASWYDTGTLMTFRVNQNVTIHIFFDCYDEFIETDEGNVSINEYAEDHNIITDEELDDCMRDNDDEWNGSTYIDFCITVNSDDGIKTDDIFNTELDFDSDYNISSALSMSFYKDILQESDVKEHIQDLLDYLNDKKEN